MAERVAVVGRAEELLERSTEIAALAGALGEVRATSRGRVVLLGAEAGGGKTALLRRFCGDLDRVLWGACDPLFTPRPLGPLLGVADRVGGELATALNRGGGPHEVTAALASELEAPRGSVLVLDDVHWADEATLDVLRLLVRRIDSVPALVVASYRDAELDRTHPLRRMLGELATSAGVQRLKLAPLSQEAVTELAAPHDVDPVNLFAKTAGNPFFVVEALAAGGEQIPDTVRDAVLARAARLGDAARSLLEAVAIVPREAEIWLLERIAPDVLGSLDECLTSGMLTSEPQGVAFRHELARLAVEDSISVARRVSLHRAALAALADAPGTVDHARLAHHAEAAGDVKAVLEYAPEAARRAAAVGAHREAVSQYARALRFGDSLSPEQRARLLEDQAGSCFVTDQYDVGIAALEEAVALRHALGHTLREGDALRRLSNFLWCPGRVEESARVGEAAVSLLETLPPSGELARAYGNVAFIHRVGARPDEAIVWGERGLRVAELVHDTEEILGESGQLAGCRDDAEALERVLDEALRRGLAAQASGTCWELGSIATMGRRHAAARRYLDAAVEYCSEHGFELTRLYALSDRARLELREGRWTEAAETAASVLRVPRTSTTPRIIALVVLALVRARRGDPEARPLLDEAWTLAEPTLELPRIAPAAAALAEAAWLDGDAASTAAAAAGGLVHAEGCHSPWLVGELAVWQRRGGVEAAAPGEIAEPYALELAGQPLRAAELWNELGCPYDSALARSHADDEEELRRALADLQELGARAAAAVVARRLRERGARGLPRGPRPATQENPALLTARELEVLELLVSGMRNSEIATRLFLSVRTVDHHVSAILRKLGVRTRSEAVAEAVAQGLVAQAR